MVETLLVLLREMDFVPVDLKAQNGNHVPFPERGMSIFKQLWLTALVILSISTLISVMTNLFCPSKLSLCLYNSKNKTVGAYTTIYLTGWCLEIKDTVSGAEVLCSYYLSSWEWPSLVLQAWTMDMLIMTTQSVAVTDTAPKSSMKCSSFGNPTNTISLVNPHCSTPNWPRVLHQT